MRTQSISLGLAIVLLCPFASAQWAPTSLDNSVQCLTVSGETLFAGTVLNGIFRSTDGGTIWTQVNSGLTDSSVKCLAVSGGNLFAGTHHGGVFCSSNAGGTWTTVNTGLPVNVLGELPGVNCLVVNGTDLFAGTSGYGVFLSANNGANWTPANAGVAYEIVYSLVASGMNLFAGSMKGLFCSTNKGTSWTKTGLAQTYVHALAVSGMNLFAGTGISYTGYEQNVFRSTDSGASWTLVRSGGLIGSFVYSLAVVGNNLFVGTGFSGVFVSTDNGATCNPANTGLPSDLMWGFPAVNCFGVSGPNLFAGTYPARAGTTRGGVWRRPLSEMTTSVEPVASELPHELLMEQNYPNPFNPSTTIKYELPKLSDVRLIVYDMLGREVEMLVNERRDAGVHEVKFDASGLSSGVYLYRLQAGDYLATKRMVFMK